jgi:membrane protein DedA with SNARE-associated domain
MLAAGTLISEDGTALTAGLLASEGALTITAATLAVWLGIWTGDLGLWLAGRLMPGVLQLSTNQRLTDAFARGAGFAIVTSRFLPGTRLAVYLAAGAGGVRLRTFAAWSALATAVWTPLIVGLAAIFGTAIAGPLRWLFGAGWVLLPVAVAVLWYGRALPERASRQARRLARWEFWPSWLFYAPVVPWVLYLLCTRGARALFAANPGLEDAGFAGESKARILASLPAPWVLPHTRLERGAPEARVNALEQWMQSSGATYPVILKPDVGQRGVGVRLVSTRDEAHAYLAAHARAAVAQVYHPGPCEAGVFYFRRPGEARGHILSITDKQLPHVVGDGVRTVRQLIRAHARYRLQAPLFLARLGARAGDVPRPGAAVRLGVAGNHAQGALFLDGSDLLTDALATRVDDIASQIDGFFIGRFDVRYRDPRAFMAGEEFAIVELNGVTSEATHIYDPSHSLWAAYRTLFTQWRLAFDIGAANVRSGRDAAGLGRLVRLSLGHLRSPS